MKRNIVFNSIKRIFNLLPSSFKRRTFFQLLLMIVNSFVDLLGLAAIIPMLAALLKEDFIQQQPLLFYVYERMGFTSESWFIVFICFLVLVVVIFKNVFGLWVQKHQMKFAASVHEFLSVRMLASAYQHGLNYFTSENSNVIQNRVVRIPLVFSTLLTKGIFQFLNEVLVLILILISITAYDPKIIGLLAVTVIPVFSLFYTLNGEKIKLIQQRINDLQPSVIKPVYEVTFGYVDVAISGVFDSFKKQFSDSVHKIKREQIRAGVLGAVPNRLIELSVIFTVILIILYSVFVIKNLENTVTLLGVFGLAAYRLLPASNRLMMGLVNIKGSEYSLDRMEQDMQDEKQKSSVRLSFKHKIEVSDLVFGFEDSKNILNEVNFQIQKGDSVGIIGRSGSGKTTLMNILLGFLEPTSGNIVIDNQVLDQSNIEAWQKVIGYVRQDVFLIDGTVAENIAFGIDGDNIDAEQLELAIKISSLGEFVETLPLGVNTPIGERGAKISGGQRQRIGIARALYHGAEVLFFDEATSALDDKTEYEITEAIEELKKHGLTLIIIAHRLSSLKFCNKYYQVEHGKVMPIDSLNS